MNYLRQLFDWCFNKPMCALVEWYEYTEALEKMREPKRARRAIQREIYR